MPALRKYYTILQIYIYIYIYHYIPYYIPFYIPFYISFYIRFYIRFLYNVAMIFPPTDGRGVPRAIPMATGTDSVTKGLPDVPRRGPRPSVAMGEWLPACPVLQMHDPD